MKKNSEILKLSVSSKTESVSQVVQALETFCESLELDKKLIETLIIATDEAITNIVLHAYGGRSDGKIQISFKMEGSEFAIQLTDYGKTFQPSTLAESNPIRVDKLKIGGYGLILMKELMDDLQFSYDNNTKSNKLIMKKYLN